MSELIQKHGGYRHLKSFQLAQLVYDVTVRFVERYIGRFSRTRDQMVQAARSGVQNIAEGSQASATSKKTELKLDYEDFLRQRGFGIWERNHPFRQALINRRCQSAGDVVKWIKESSKEYRPQSTPSTMSTPSTKSTTIYPELSANAALVLIAVARALLDRQVERLARDFEDKGGFTERLYNTRSSKRNRDNLRKD